MQTAMNAKAIPFRKSRRKQGESLVRPTARIIPASAVNVAGETMIRTLPARPRARAA